VSRMYGAGVSHALVVCNTYSRYNGSALVADRAIFGCAVRVNVKKGQALDSLPALSR